MSLRSNPILFTLCEGDYHLGVAALFNSAYRVDFPGTYVVGYRGAIPPWSNQLLQKDGTHQLGKSEMHFIQLDPAMHFGYYKPFFALELAERFPNYSSLIYADPDVLLLAPWTFFDEWFDANPAIGLCADQNFVNLSANHPWRRGWRKLIGHAGLELCDSAAPYANSGFVACHSYCVELWQRWEKLTNAYMRDGNSVDSFRMTERWRCVVGDQDLLAPALMCTDASQVSLLGQEGMGFNRDFKFLCHVTEQPKPWKPKYLLRAFAGYPPSEAVKTWKKLSGGPISLGSQYRLIEEKIDLTLAKFVGRFYRR